MTKTAGELVRDARRRSGLSQAEYARRAGVSQPVVSAYENGRREPSLPMLRRLVEASGHELRIDIVSEPAFDASPERLLRDRLVRLREEILERAARRGIRNLRVFGSVARGQDDADSDVDLVADLDERVTLIDLIGLERELGDLLGRPVEVIPSTSLKDAVAVDAFEDAIPL